jgi:hypothetical protein
MMSLARMASLHYPAIARNLSGAGWRWCLRWTRRIAFLPVAGLMMLFLAVAYYLDTFAERLDPEDHDRLSSWFLDP